MKVLSVRLQSFLSYSAASVEFSDGLNVITGENASGKTNLIDSIYYASIGKSSRQNKDKDLIRWKSEGGARVTVKVQKKYGKHEIDISIDPQGKKRVLVDGVPLLRLGELMGVLNVVFFSPNEMRLVKESPQDRRRFMDIHLCQQSKTYFYTLQRYQKLLVQRNTLLKTYQGRLALDGMLNAVDADFAKAAAFLSEERGKFVECVVPYAKDVHLKLTEGKEEMHLGYESNCKGTEEEIREKLRTARDTDAKMQFSTVGPHRDDIRISLNGVDIRKYGSQGQQRSAVLSLKLAEIETLKDRTGEAPVLLLDDVLSELDMGRQTALFRAISGVQTMVTCTEFDRPYDGNYRKFTVADRAVRAEEINGN